MPRTTTVEIRESVEELLETMKSQKKISKRSRIQSLYLLKGGHCTTVSQVASILGISRKTVQGWLSIYQHQGLSALLKNNKIKSGRRGKIPEVIAQEIKQLLERQSFQTYTEIQSWLKIKHQIDVTYDVVYSLVRDRLKMSI